jgi:flagellar P-ring protein precursor FlgI
MEERLVMYAVARRWSWLLALTLLVGGVSPARAQMVRIKDLTDLEGARGNQLYGFGLVIGLAGTGSRSLFTQQIAVDMLQKLNVSAKIFNQSPSDNVIRATNVSAVMVTAEIGPFNRNGSRIDVTVASMDDATSLQGGVLLLTPLHGADGEIYAVAQGPLSIGGFVLSGQAATVQKNHPTVGRIVGGATVEREALGEVICQGFSKFLLRNPDFNTARKIAKVINEYYPGTANPIDGGAVAVKIPPTHKNAAVAFLSEAGLLEVRPDTTARVVINENTGTVVVGGDVKIAATAVAHGNLTITINETPIVSQPAPFSGGTTTVVPRTTINATEAAPRLNVVGTSVTVAELARALNALGVTPRDLIPIFQALKEAGALYAEIVKF